MTNTTTSPKPDALIFQCPDCGKDIADNEEPHTLDCPRRTKPVPDAVRTVEELRTRMPKYVSTWARELAGEAIDDMSGERHDSGVYALAQWFDALSAPISPADGALESDIKLIGTALSLGDHPGGVTQAFYRIAAAVRSPSATGAAEPDAWRDALEEIQRMALAGFKGDEDGDSMLSNIHNLALKTLSDAGKGMAITALPPVRGNREAIALKCWKNGKLEPCTIDEFVQNLRSLANWADQGFGIRSDPSAHLGERLEAAATAILSLTVQPGTAEPK